MDFASFTRVAVESVFYSSIGFIIVVSRFWPWWQSQLGWTIAAKSIALGLAVLPAMLIYWFGHDAFTDSAPLKWGSVGMLFLIPLILAWRAWVLYGIQKRSRAAARNGQPPALPPDGEAVLPQHQHDNGPVDPVA